MTLFNARLGAWLGNPGPAGEGTWREAGPRSAVRSLAKEALGLTSERSEYVYLSDGGRFENLALYEVVRRRSAAARIRYSAVDGPCEDGWLLYLKPVLLGTEPPDVASYAAAHPDFPHQGTGDQWFDESQTESYRMLGLHTVNEVLAGAPPDLLEAGGLEALRRHVEEAYLAPAP